MGRALGLSWSSKEAFDPGQGRARREGRGWGGFLRAYVLLNSSILYLVKRGAYVFLMPLIFRKLSCHQSKMPFSKQTCMKILEIWE